MDIGRNNIPPKPSFASSRPNKPDQKLSLVALDKKDINQGASDVREFFLEKQQPWTTFSDKCDLLLMELTTTGKNISTLKVVVQDGEIENISDLGMLDSFEDHLFRLFLAILLMKKDGKLPNLKVFDLSAHKDENLIKDIVDSTHQAVLQFIRNYGWGEDVTKTLDTIEAIKFSGNEIDYSSSEKFWNKNTELDFYCPLMKDWRSKFVWNS